MGIQANLTAKLTGGNGVQRNSGQVQRLVSDHPLFTLANALDH